MPENDQNIVTESRQGEILRVSLSYGQLKAEFSGSPESVLQSLVSFLSKQIPALNLAQKISLNYSVTELISRFQDYLKITAEGPRINIGSKLSDKELVAVQLVGQKIAFETGNTKTPSTNLSYLQEATGMNPKTLSSRLSELSKDGYVNRESAPEGTMFRITTQGISWIIDDLKKKNMKT